MYLHKLPKIRAGVVHLTQSLISWNTAWSSIRNGGSV